MIPRAREIVQKLDEIKATSGPEALWRPTQQSALMAELMVIVAEEQEKSAAKLEQETARLVDETVELRRLTRGLYFFTIIVAGFALIQIFIMLLEYCSKLSGSP